MCMIKNIMLPVDGSSFSEKAGVLAIYLAKKLDAKLSAVHVVGLGKATKLENDNIESARIKQAETIFSSIREKASKESLEIETKILVSRDIPETILEESKDGSYDLIIIASHGLSGIKKIILGSVTDDVLKKSTIPVLVSK
jgi:nucleotide-binding universal stress UspA family protein